MVAELREASADPPMATGAEPRQSPGSVRVRTLLYIRWFAIVGQAVALLVVHEFLDLKLPLADCLALLVASILVNLYLLLTRSSSAWLPEHEAAFSLAYDVVQLSALLYLTGGLQNPFALLILTPITVSATILSLRSTLLLGLFVAISISLLGLVHEPLPWTARAGFALPSLYLWGLWTALTFATAFIAVYVSRVATEARIMEAALTETQIALAREQRASAVGSLAAAVAHELGSPLGTIAVVAKELALDVAADSPLRPDIDLLVSETGRCRDILAQLAQAREDDDADSPFQTPPLSALVEEVMTQQGATLVPIELRREPTDAIAEPNVARQPGMLHGFANLIQNAVQFARTRVTVTIAWSSRDVSVTVEDDGPGFSAAVLARLGEPYISSRAGSAGHMGLGVFIAQTLLSRTGARIAYGNTEEGGARVAIHWRRADIEA